MLFLAAIIAIGLLQVWGTAERVHSDAWFHSWRSRVAGWDLSGGIQLVMVVLLPSLLALWALDLLEHVLFGVPWIGAAALLLLYGFGRGDFRDAMAHYRGHAHSGDFEGAYLAACEEFGWDEPDDRPGSANEVHALIQQALVYEGFQRWFAVLFYFVVLGPAGALAYRLVQLCRGQFEPAITERWLFYLDWIPARLLAAAFALTGDFIGSRSALLAAVQDASKEACELLYGVATAALGSGLAGPDAEGVDFGPAAAVQNRELASLLSRSAVCWVVVLALLVLLF